MKIAFSTLGCPGWTYDDMLATAKDLGFDGIELRGIENELYIPKAKPFSDEKLPATVERLKKLNIEIPCLTSSCYLFDKGNIDFYMKEGKEYIDLASKIGTPFIRVLGDQNPEPGKDIDLDFVATNLKLLGEYAEGKNVKVLLETNGVLADSIKILNLIKKAENKNIGVLWDVHHPFRYFGETVNKTYDMLKDYIYYIHIKDSIIENGKVRYRIMGHGDVPVKDAITALKNNGYKGYISLEWVKRWCLDLEEPGVVFSQFVNFVNQHK